MKVILKYPLQIKALSIGAEIVMPAKGKILTVQPQRGIPTLWVEVEPGEPLETRTFFLVPTGQPFPVIENGNYLGTIQDIMGIVLHCYEEIKK